MKPLKTIFILSLSLIFISASCEKPDPEPVFTQGFSCKINGEEWIAKTPVSISGPVALDVNYDENTGLLFLHAVRKDNDKNIYDIINIFSKNIYDISSNEIISVNEDMDEIVGFLSLSNNTGCGGYAHDSLNPGTLKICIFDKTKREISGTFNMTLIAYKCNNEIMHITDGKFAFRY